MMHGVEPAAMLEQAAQRLVAGLLSNRCKRKKVIALELESEDVPLPIAHQMISRMSELKRKTAMSVFMDARLSWVRAWAGDLKVDYVITKRMRCARVRVLLRVHQKAVKPAPVARTMQDDAELLVHFAILGR